MKPEHKFDAAEPVPVWTPVSAARRMVAEKIGEFMEMAAAHELTEGIEAPALAMRITAGVGKTSAALSELARRADALLGRGHVLVYMPTLELAERAAADFGRIAPSVPCRIIRGRQALDPDSKNSPREQMCARYDVVEQITGLVPSVTEAMCRAKNSDGIVTKAGCAEGCPYLRQLDVTGAHVTFLSHAYLGVRPPVDPAFPVALRIVDEKVWGTLARTSSIYVEDFMLAAPPSFPTNLLHDLARAKAAIIDGLQRSAPLHDHLRSAGISSDLLLDLARAEGADQEQLDIRPWHEDLSRGQRVSAFDRQKLTASRRRQAIFAVLAEGHSGHCNQVSFSEGLQGSDKRQNLQIHRLVALPRDAPVLLLDADADAEITERLASGAAFQRIDVRPVADVVQTKELTFSNSWLLDKEKGAARRASIMKIIAREVEQAGGAGVLVVATKPVLEQLHRDAGQRIGGDRDSELRQALLGASPLWFGPRTQGINDFENFGTAIIVGRLQPPIGAVEDFARCLSGNDPNPIATHKNGPLPEVPCDRLMSDGRLVPAKARKHEDPRVQLILAQERECSTLQAIARLRLVSPRQPKRVVVLSDLPLPGFPITRLAPFRAIERGLEQEPDIEGFLRLEAALRATMKKAVLGIRLSNAGLAADLPLEFPTFNSAHGFRKGRSTADIFALIRRIATDNRWPMTALQLRRNGLGGQPIPAVVFAEQGQAVKHARALWPGLAPK